MPLLTHLIKIKSMNNIIRIKTITELHNLLGSTKPKHPLVTVFYRDSQEMSNPDTQSKMRYVLDFYIISLKQFKGVLRYGRNYYDFEEGTLIFTAPGQVITVESEADEAITEGWALFFHPDLIRRSDLAKKITDYTFFSYETHEALHISDQEKKTITNCVDMIEQEYSQNIDKHSQNLIVSNIELLLDYCTRFYDRQFMTRANHNRDIVSKFEQLLTSYFSSDKPKESGLLTVRQCADELHFSPNYLSDLLKKETGKNTQEHIHHCVIEQAKMRLLGTEQTISEIAYNLGFEYAAYFSKVFKNKTGLSPAEYRKG